MEKLRGRRHWFLEEEFKWRSFASAVWTWNTTFPIVAVFLFGFTFDASKHIFIIYDFLGALLSIHTLGVCIAMASLSALLVWLHLRYYAVVPSFPSYRLELVQNIAKTSSLVFILANALYTMSIAHLATSLLSGKYSWDYRCTSSEMDPDSTKYCQNGFHQLFLLFGIIAGFFSGVNRLLNQEYSLDFLHVQEAKVLSVKCGFPRTVYDCAVKSAKGVYKFLIFYYIIGFVLRDIAVISSGVQSSELLSIQVWRIFHAIPVVWNLWLVGTLSLLLWETSWKFFNIYQTRGYNFLLQPVLPENHFKLLVENMEDSNPAIVQHLAYRQLSLIARQNPSKRQQIFALSRSTENGQPISWNRILSNCLGRVNLLTSNIADYHLALSDIGKRPDDAAKSVDISDEDTTMAPLYIRQRQFVSHVHDISASSYSDRTLPNVSVPTPRLWTTFSENAVVEEESPKVMQVFGNGASQIGAMRNRIQTFAEKLPVYNYFLKMIPSWTLRNVYQEHMIVKWALQSLSYLCAASLEEDEFGVVQGRLRDIITCFVDLLMALENLSKVAISSNFVNKIHLGLCNEVKSALHRIVGSYGESLNSINLPQEYRTRLLAFVPYDD